MCKFCSIHLGRIQTWSSAMEYCLLSHHATFLTKIGKSSLSYQLPFLASVALILVYIFSCADHMGKLDLQNNSSCNSYILCILKDTHFSNVEIVEIHDLVHLPSFLLV